MHRDFQVMERSNGKAGRVQEEGMGRAHLSDFSFKMITLPTPSLGLRIRDAKMNRRAYQPPAAHRPL